MGTEELCIKIFVPEDEKNLANSFFLDPTTVADSATSIYSMYHSYTISSNPFSFPLTDESDYKSFNGDIVNPLILANFGSNLRRFCFDVTIIDDDLFELPETFNVTIKLSTDSPTSGIRVQPSVTVITIIDDDCKCLWSSLVSRIIIILSKCTEVLSGFSYSHITL